MSSLKKLAVELGDRRYEIFVGTGLLEHADTYLVPVLRQKRAVIVTDVHVARLHAAKLETALARAGVETHRLVLPAGEATKTFDQLGRLIEDLLALKVERATTLLALGGGVIGDIAGVAASLTLRGLPYVQIPTTLLAQVDSAVGGKTAVNSTHGKNLIGSFYQPRLVLSDLATLDTLARREVLAGYAEVVKYRLIRDAGFFAWLEKNGTHVIAGDREAQTHAVLTSCAAKAAIVAADEREALERKLLNFGHTFAHAFEAAAGYDGALLHGEAVAMGMAAAMDLSVRLGLCPAADAARARAHLAHVGLALKPGERLDVATWRAERLIELMEQDKKVEGGKIAFVLSRGIGKAFVTDGVPTERLREALAHALAA